MTSAIAPAADRLDIATIENVLRRHPLVAAVRVARRDGGRAVATVTARPNCPEMEAEQLARWREVYDESFTVGDPADMLQGWISSYTGAPLPPADMEEWLETTADRIFDLAPRHVVEIGSGTGLLVERIAPKVESYLAIDGSTACQNRLSYLIQERPDLRQVRQIVGDAADLPSALRADIVILNSVVQYFPNRAYLARVLDRALGWIETGAIFVGDVRDLRLLPDFQASRARHLGISDPAAVSRFVHKHIDREDELVIDPAYFFDFGQKRSQIHHVRALLKRGRHRNELSRYRYDVILHVGSAPVSPNRHHHIATFGSMAELSETLTAYSDRGADLVVLDGVPNARLVSPANGSAADPEDFFALGATLGYRVEIAPGPDPERFDAVFYRGKIPPMMPDKTGWNRAAGDDLTNDPALPLARSLLPGRLRAYLKERLPDVAAAVSIVVAETGKKVLVGEQVRDSSMLDGLVALWRECLQSRTTGPDDDFFANGGSSLLAMVLRQRIVEAFGVSIPLGRFAAAATPRAVAAFIQDAVDAKSGR